MIDYKLVCLIFLAFGFNTVKSQNINYKTLLGIEHSNLVGDSLKLEKNTFIALPHHKFQTLAFHPPSPPPCVALASQSPPAKETHLVERE